MAKASKRKLIDGIRNKQEDVNNDRKFIQTFVGNEGVLSCNNCGKLFNRQAVLRVHLTSCKFKKMYTCNTIPEKKNRVSQNNGLPVKSTIQKSGILVRKDYCKKLNCDSVSFKSSLTNQIVRDNSFSEQSSLKRINKWKNVLQKLQTRNNELETSEKATLNRIEFKQEKKNFNMEKEIEEKKKALKEMIVKKL